MIEVWLLEWWGYVCHRPSSSIGLAWRSRLNATFLLLPYVVFSVLVLSHWVSSRLCYLLFHPFLWYSCKPPRTHLCLVSIPSPGRERAAPLLDPFLSGLPTGTCASFAFCKSSVCRVPPGLSLLPKKGLLVPLLFNWNLMTPYTLKLSPTRKYFLSLSLQGARRDKGF